MDAVRSAHIAPTSLFCQIQFMQSARNIVGEVSLLVPLRKTGVRQIALVPRSARPDQYKLAVFADPAEAIGSKLS
jgi:hypothetical protein